MAYDPEARQSSNSAMIIGIIALVLAAGAVLAYYATRHPEADETTPSTTIVNNHQAPAPATNPVVVAPATTPTPNTIVVPGKTVTRVERHNTTINRTINRTVPAPNASSSPSGSSNTTINIAPPANTSNNSGTNGNLANGNSANGNSAAGSASNSSTGSSATNSATGTDNSVANDAANAATSNTVTGF